MTVSKEIQVQLDRPRRLILDDQALVIFEADGGDLSNFAFGKATLWDLVHLLRACLAHEDDNLTIDQVMKMVNEHNIQITFVQLLKLLRGVVEQVTKILKSEGKKNG